MKRERDVIRPFISLALGLLLLGALPLYAEKSVGIVPRPGVYATDQLLSFTPPPQTRLTVFLDGKRLENSADAVLLSAGQGEQRTWQIQTELRSLDPRSPLLESRVYEWVIDKKRPAPPLFTLTRKDGGVAAVMTSDEPATMHYTSYHPYYRALSRGTVPHDKPVFLPDGAVLCAYAVDRAGNRSSALSITAEHGVYAEKPFTLINPVPGTWGNLQTLVIDSVPGVEIRYTTDGSDPRQTGQTYTGPALLDITGSVTVRIAAKSPDNRWWTDSVLYTVVERPSGLENAITLTEGIFETGSFYEAVLPGGFTCTIGNPWQSGKQQTTILFSVPEGIRRYYPVTVRNDSRHWRWICASGDLAPQSETRNTDPETTGTPLVQIHDWHFITFNLDDPVYYSRDGRSWLLYTEPVVLERDTNATLHWYSPSRDNGTVRTISLPVKPELSGLPSGGVTANPVFLTVSPSPYTLHYSVGGEYPPVPAAADTGPVLASGLLLETPHGASETFTVRLHAVHDGIVHGDITSRFVLDRKSPREPSLGIPADLSYSRNPVTLHVSGEDMIQVSITPALFEHSGSAWVLNGDPEQPVTYTVSSFAVDRAGNRSSVIEQTITVDLNALYVNSQYSGLHTPDGSPSAPFTDLDSALALVQGPVPWRISVQGTVRMDRPHTLRSGVTLSGSNAQIHAGSAGVIRSYSRNLSISGIVISRTAQTARGTPGPAGPLIEITDGTLSVSNCSVHDASQTSASLLRAEKARISLQGSRFSRASDEYAIIVDARNSTFFARDCNFESSSRIVSALALTGGRSTFTNCEIRVHAASAGRAIETWGTSLVVQGLRLIRSGNERNNDTGLWMDRKTVMVSEHNLEVEGFRFTRKSGDR